MNRSPNESGRRVRNRDVSGPRAAFRATAVAVGLMVGSILLIGVASGTVLTLAERASFDPVRWRVAVFATQTVAAQIAVGSLGVAYLLATGRGLGYLRARLPDSRELFVAVLSPFALLTLAVGAGLLSAVIGVFPSQHGFTAAGQANPPLLLALIPVVILFTGPFEELLYRGVIQNRFAEAVGPRAAVVLASAIFAAAHAPAYGFLPGANTPNPGLFASLGLVFVVSLGLGALYERTRNLTVVALAHGLYNALLLGLAYVFIVYGPGFDAVSSAVSLAGVL